jgi:radical SAM superfamily enzyme YgiQ (UPF0313 family)
MTPAARHRLDLVLINPGNRSRVFQSLGSGLAAIEPPVWAGLIASAVRSRGFSVALIDANAEGLTPDETAERLAELRPRLTAVVVYGHQPSASTQNMPAVSDICKSLKRRDPNGPILLVGGHVAALPERTLNEEAADYVCDGEGPLTIIELLEALRSGEVDPGKVRGLWYREGGVVKTAPAAPLMQDLDHEMSGIAWDLLPMHLYRAHNWHCFGGLPRMPYASLYTSLGCPYHCSFCCIQAPFRSGEKALGIKRSVNSYRLWSPRSVIAQIDVLVERYGVRNIKIADEIFVLHPGHVSDICDLIIQRGYDLNLWAYARLDTLKEEMIEKMKRAGINWLAFGIEAASERVRDDARKGYRQEKVFRIIEAVRDQGINVIGNYIFGLPEDDRETMEDTLKLAVDLNCEFANFYCAMAYPGSQLYDLSIRNGWPLPESWSGYSQHAVDTTPLPTRHLSAADVLRFRDHAFQVYFTGKRYLDMVTSKFGVETADQIRKMTEHKLERKLLMEKQTP